MQKELDQLTTKELGQLFPVRLTEANPNWKNIFLSEKEKIIKILDSGDKIRTEHIGSTAIPNLISKPTIDILMEISESINPERIIEKLQSFNYHYISRPDNPPPHIMLVKGYTKNGFKGQAFHIHVRYFGDWDEIYFRDYLIKHKDAADEYAVLKVKLAEKFRNDREAYTDAKLDFVEKINKMARNETGN